MGLESVLEAPSDDQKSSSVQGDTETESSFSLSSLPSISLPKSKPVEEIEADDLGRSLSNITWQSCEVPLEEPEETKLVKK
mmetsp:Transcript_41635/g.63564  ORF Transcript_41635/g.63564 Transcript_41635/m.63564 type:complete len:81 (+) Transcript_41635:191-433(+)